MENAAKTPLVSVLCLSYNQKDFIKQCLDGILAQNTNFDYEVLINDDASNDGTREIIEEYQKQYPDIIKPVLHKKNQYSQGIRNMIMRFLLPKAKGKYLALCEGDDYWTDPDKLQKQVNFMNDHPNYSLCFHKVLVAYENKEKPDQIYPDVDNKNWYTHRELFNTNYIQTCSVMYRAMDYEGMPLDSMPGDWFLHLYHARFGKVKLLDDVMAVYRKHAGGIWWGYDRDKEQLWRYHGVSHLAMWVNLLRIYAKKPAFVSVIKRQITDIVNTLVHLDSKFGDVNFSVALDRYPKEVYATLETQAKELSARRYDVKELTDQLGHKEQEVADLIAQLNAKEQELLYIKSTKTWRLRHSVRQSAKKAGIRKKSQG